MSPIKACARTTAIVLAAAWLSGCVTVFPKEKPAQLYRFDGAPPASDNQAPAPAAAGASFSVLRASGTFTRAASGDRILAIDGEKAAFIAEARWLAPAQTLFDEAAARAFDANRGPARLVNRGQAGRADYVLRIDVRRFEVVYDHGKGAPLVVVSLRAALMGSDRTLVGDQMFEAKVRAGDNRVSAIVGAFDLAVGEVLTKLMDWTNKASKPA